jgi:hypothetical protein
MLTLNSSTILTLQTQQSTSLQVFTAKMAAHVDRWANLMTSRGLMKVNASDGMSLSRIEIKLPGVWRSQKNVTKCYED